MYGFRRLPFGKYKGRRLEDVPTGYLVWVVNHVDRLDPYLRRAIEHELDDRNPAEAGANSNERHAGDGSLPAAWSGIITTWYRQLVRDYHPDRGGSVEVMAALNEANDRLRKLLGV
jgi:hypothetical protein